MVIEVPEYKFELGICSSRCFHIEEMGNLVRLKHAPKFAGWCMSVDQKGSTLLEYVEWSAAV
jgi:hypothetical protein